LKGLALHTANDSGPTGPDATFGWGLLNAKRAAEVVTGRGTTSILLETSISQGASFKTKFKAKGIVQVSISWTDPPGTAVAESVINSTTPVLINDLDLRVTRQGSSLMPWKLISHSTNARGDNNVDPFERIDDSNPTIQEYEVTVSHKGSLRNGSQNFSLIVTGDSLEQQAPLIANDQSIRYQNNIGSIQEELKQIAERIQEIAKRLDDLQPLPTSNYRRVFDFKDAPTIKIPKSDRGSIPNEIKMELMTLDKSDKGDSRNGLVRKLLLLLDRLERDPNDEGIMAALNPDFNPSSPQYGLKPGIGTPEGNK
jgi:hypothetical protein